MLSICKSCDIFFLEIEYNILTIELIFLSEIDPLYSILINFSIIYFPPAAIYNYLDRMNYREKRQSRTVTGFCQNDM